MTNFSIQFKNNSTQGGYICAFQRLKNTWGNWPSVVWLTQYCIPHATTYLRWQDNFCFVYGHGSLKPGTLFMTKQHAAADPNGNNQISLDITTGFSNPQNNGRIGSLTIVTDAHVPPASQTAIGIGMSDKATLVTAAAPNMYTSFDTHIEYWVAFGQYEQGAVLPAEVNKAIQVNFLSGDTTAIVTLNPDGQLTIS